jgi:hypothetical protein
MVDHSPFSISPTFSSNQILERGLCTFYNRWDSQKLRSLQDKKTTVIKFR